MSSLQDRHLETKAVQAGEHKGKRFLSCDNWRKDDPEGLQARGLAEAGRPGRRAAAGRRLDLRQMRQGPSSS